MLLKAIVGVAVLILGVAIFAGAAALQALPDPSGAMEPTIHQGETVTLNGGEELKLGDIVILNPPQGAEESKKCAARRPSRSPVREGEAAAGPRSS